MVGFWESSPDQKKYVEFILENPNKPMMKHKLVMEVYVMGRGSTQNADLFFSGPAILFLGMRYDTEDELIHYSAREDVSKAKVSGYSIYKRKGRAAFSANLGPCFS
jgi:hypothetical protein